MKVVELVDYRLIMCPLVHDIARYCYIYQISTYIFYEILSIDFKYCHNPNNNTTQPQHCSWVGYEKDCAYHQGGILSGSAAAQLTEIFRNWTQILVENHAFLSHFGLEQENLSYRTEINLFKNRRKKLVIKIFSGFERIFSNRNQFFPKKID